MNKRTTIELSGNEYKIGFAFYAIKLFEEMTGKSIQESKSTWDSLVYCYCTLKALNENFTLSMDQFVDLLDENPQLLIDIQFATASPSDQEPVAEPVEAKKKGLLKTFFGLWMLSVLLLVSPVLIPVIFGSIWIFGSIKALYRLIANRGNKPAPSFRHSPANV